jgi:hypothetical protein
MSDDIMNSTALYNVTRPLNTREATKYLWDKWRVKRAPSTLETDRSRGGGPEPFYIGFNAFYWPADLDAWVLARMTPKVGSASEAKQIRLARRKLIEDDSKPSKATTSKSKQRKPAQKDYDGNKSK